MAMRYIIKLCLLSIGILSILACSEPIPESEQTFTTRTIEEQLGTVFSPIKDAHFKAPTVTQLPLNFVNNGAALWGATGKDDQGRIYFGVSSYYQYDNNSFLYQFDPKTNETVFQGDTITQLKKAGLYSPGVSQNKLHSKFYQADDGYLYFASFDENGESVSKEILPTHGGHLWRKKPDSTEWEHLLATNEALIALNTDGRYVYALGYWGHVLYQYDILTRRFNRMSIGSKKGHISRNFLIAPNGHVFIPQIIELADEQYATELLELDNKLNAVTTHTIEHYFSDKKYVDHGIVGYANTRKGHIFFNTGAGALYKLELQENRSYQLQFKRFWADQDTSAVYMPSLFTLDGDSFIVGMGKAYGEDLYSWFIYEESTDTSVNYQLDDIVSSKLLYGSVTKDHKGNMYVVGVDRSDRQKHRPIVLQLSYEDTIR